MEDVYWNFIIEAHEQSDSDNKKDHHMNKMPGKNFHFFFHFWRWKIAPKYDLFLKDDLTY